MENLAQALGMNKSEFEAYYLAQKNMVMALGFSEEQFFEMFKETVTKTVISLQ